MKKLRGDSMVRIISFLMLFFLSCLVNAQQNIKMVKSQTVTRNTFDKNDSLLHSFEIISVLYNTQGDTIKMKKYEHQPNLTKVEEKTKFRRNKKIVQIKKKNIQTEIKKYDKNNLLLSRKFIAHKNSPFYQSHKVSYSTYEYNALGDLIKQSYLFKKSRLSLKSGRFYIYDYDSNHNKIKSSHFLHKGAKPIIINYIYNHQGLLFKELHDRGGFIYRYDHKDSLISKSSMNYKNSDTLIITWKQFTYTDTSYTVLDLITRESKTFLNSGQLLTFCLPKRDSICFKYKYNNAGNLLESIITGPDSTVTIETNLYDYRGCLIKKTMGKSQRTFEYNDRNLLIKKEEFQLGIPYSITLYQYNNLDQLVRTELMFYEDVNWGERLIITEFDYTYY